MEKFQTEYAVDSTTEAEYITASDAVKEAIWIKKFMTELIVVPSIESVVPLYCDNNGAVIHVTAYSPVRCNVIM